jgi:hypothetical protein
MIWVSPGVLSWGDSKSDGPKLVPFLIGLENAKYWWNPGGFTSVLDGSTCIWTHFSRRIQIWIEKHEILTAALNMARSMMVAEMRIGWPPLNGMVWLVSRPVFWGEPISEQRNMKFSLQLSIWLDQWWWLKWGLGDLLWMEWFDLCLDRFFEENPYLNRETWNSHYNP